MGYARHENNVSYPSTHLHTVHDADKRRQKQNSKTRYFLTLRQIRS